MKGEGKGVPRWAVLSAALAALAAFPSSAGAVSFFRGDVPVGTHPTSVAVGNFNGGAPDLAVATEGTDDVSILLGNGFGQFTTGTPVSVGDAPSSVVTGNFNGDAFTDIAIASVGDDNVAIKLGDGAGGFSGTVTVSTGASSDPRAIATGDFNNDGKTDLVSANQGSSTVSFLLGDGMGDFAADGTPFNAATGGAANPGALAAIQMGGTTGTPNTDLDAMIASQANDQVLSLFNDGTGEITGWGTNYLAMGIPGADPSAIAVGSLNPGSSNPGNAAEPDILIANQGVDQVWPAYGRTDGQAFDFGGVEMTGADPVAIAMGDLDGDGYDDGITANRVGATATVILSNGNGDVEADTSPAVGNAPSAVATGAFDADTRDDVAVANYDSNSVSVLTSLTPGPPPVANLPASTPVAPKKKKCKKKHKRSASAAKKRMCKKKRR
jgi:FG-GAP-like repeat